jgi:hypothetical protein
MSDRNTEMKKLMVDMKQLFHACAAVDTSEGISAYKEFCAAIKTPILQEIKLVSTVRELFAVETLGPGATAMYPVADDFELPVWILPGLGHVAQNFIEGVGEDVFVPTFTIDTAAEWKLSYARESRIDIAASAARKAARAIAEYEEESGWRILGPASTTNFAATGLLKARNAPVYEVAAAGSGAGYLSKELINKMIIGFQRTGRALTDLWVAPEDAADIREWTETDIDPVTRREIFQAAGMGRIWNVQLHVLPHLGQQGKFNINDSTSSYGIFKADAADDYNDYHLDSPNVVDSNGAVTTAGETQIWGFDMTANDSLVMPIKQEFQVFDDSTLHRRQKQGFYGWEEVGFACLDSRMIALGIIDRTV